jgi:hypothetical protein
VASFFISLFLRFIDGLPTLHTLIHYPFDQGSGYVIVPVDRLGLANRLRIIASAFTIASLESKHLLILWKPSKECNFQFHSIFQPLVGSSSTSIDVLSVDEDLEFDSTNLKSIFLELSTVVPHEIVIRYPNKFFFNNLTAKDLCSSSHDLSHSLANQLYRIHEIQDRILSQIASNSIDKTSNR